jgi:hypothetical protein
MPVPGFPGPSTTLTPGGLKRGVIVLMHGIEIGFPSPLVDFISPPSLYNTLATDLQTDGWVVIWPTLLGDAFGGSQFSGWSADLANDAGHGSRLATSIGLWWDHCIDYLAVHYPGLPVVPLGISLGGLQCIQIATQRASTLAAYCAHIPLLLPWTLNFLALWNLAPKLSFTLAVGENGLTLPQSTLTVNEAISVQNPPQSGCLVVAGNPQPQIIRYTSWAGSTFSGVTGGDGVSTMATNGSVTQSSHTSGLDVPMTALNALGNGSQGTVPVGYLGWETGDTGVGYPNIQTLYNNAIGASQPVSHTARSGGTHQMDATDVAAITGWFTATVDPLCPKAF